MKLVMVSLVPILPRQEVLVAASPPCIVQLPPNTNVTDFLDATSSMPWWHCLTNQIVNDLEAPDCTGPPNWALCVGSHPVGNVGLAP